MILGNFNFRAVTVVMLMAQNLWRNTSVQLIGLVLFCLKVITAKIMHRSCPLLDGFNAASLFVMFGIVCDDKLVLSLEWSTIEPKLFESLVDSNLL